jgi:hypothetical protein
VEQFFPYGDSKKNNFPGSGWYFFIFIGVPGKKFWKKIYCFQEAPPCFILPGYLKKNFGKKNLAFFIELLYF